MAKNSEGQDVVQVRTRQSRRGIDLGHGVRIPDAELQVRQTRSSGPGGQHVNKASTRVELCFDVVASVALTEAQKERVQRQLATRISRQGILRVVSQSQRSAVQNERQARERLAELLRQALHVPHRRRATRPSTGSKEERLQAKRNRAELKRNRKPEPDRD